ncbi:FAD-binding PCMH-type domain-containing protein [Mycena sanguinolenta]|uniref:D-arabinono-1,4-lactone oxidase n=1 Tax=Mycena sanguinolenta TaxID=230812 RepID=A0A8H7DFB2_9AGAR|nr:FAD-binding PCMH-type domain-containing protein [Mycena sanguinolenta]
MHETNYASLPRTALVAALEPIAVTRPRWENWARTFQAIPRALFMPTSVHHCRIALELARRDHRVLRPVGIGHSPSDVACTRDYMLDMTRMNAVLEVNATECYVVAQAGITLTDLHIALGEHGLAMRNLGSISDQTLAGIVTTATHGSGVSFGVMSTHVLGLTLLTPSNTIVSCSPSENRDLFDATVEKAFRLREVQTVRPFGDVVRDLDELKRDGEHVRLWRCALLFLASFIIVDILQAPNPGWLLVLAFSLLVRVPRRAVLTAIVQIRPAIAKVAFLGFAHPPRTLPRACASHPFRTYLGRAPRVLSRRPGGAVVDNSVNVFNVECRYPQHTTEWALPSSRAKACLTELGEWLKAEAKDPEGERPHFPIEIRFSAADELWMSPSNGEETCWIGIVQFKPYNLPTRYRALFATFERILASHGGRPHWAKAHHLDACSVRRLYPQFHRFLGVVKEVDPEGTFRNEYLERHLLGRPGASDGREFKVWRGLPTPSLCGEEQNRGQSWWATWLWPQKSKAPEPDWRVPPPEEELREERERRRSAAVWSDDEAAVDSSASEDSDGESEVTLVGSAQMQEGKEKCPARTLVGSPEN